MQNSPDQDVVPAVEWRDMMLRSMDALSARVGALDDSVNSLRQVTTTLSEELRDRDADVERRTSEILGRATDGISKRLDSHAQELEGLKSRRLGGSLLTGGSAGGIGTAIVLAVKELATHLAK